MTLTADMTTILAAAPDQVLSGNWLVQALILLIGAVITGVGGVWLRKVSLEQGRRENVTLSEPVPPLTVRRINEPPTWDQHAELQHRVNALEHTTAELRRDLACQFRELLQAGGDRETRLAEKLDGIARGIHHRVDEMMRNCANQCANQAAGHAARK